MMVARLKSLRQKKGISQQQLATALGTSQQSINKYENHSIEPDIDMLMKMADFFDTSVDYLVGYSDVARKVETVWTFELNEDESSVIEQYRVLTPKERESIRLVMENYLNRAK